MKTSMIKWPVMILAIVLFCCTQSCQKTVSSNGHSGTSSVHVYLTDDPSLVFDKLFLDIRQLEIKVEDNDQERHENEHQRDVDDNDGHGDKSGGWMTIPVNAGVYDILRFRNGLDTLFGTGSFPAIQKLKKIRLTLGNNNSVVINGVNIPLAVKDQDNFVVIKIDESTVNINSGGITHLWIDIDGSRSVSRHGNNFELKLNCKGFSKEKMASIEGRVLPQAAGAIVMAINGTDTASAIPEKEGEFKFTGLKAGNYSLLYHATTGGYADSTVNNLSLKTNEDTKLPAVMLHK